MASKEQLIALFKDEAFVKEMNAAKNEEECLALFAAKGIETTIDEIKGLGSSEELSVDKLNSVAGGYVVCYVIGGAMEGNVDACWDAEGHGAIACYYIGIGLGVTSCDNKAYLEWGH